MYDVIVVGGRVAGSSTAMLLARRGYKVLVVDRAAFPSDTLSTHQVQVPGIAMLDRWGLLDRVIASGAPATRHLRFDQELAQLDGHSPPSRASTRCTARGARCWTRSCWTWRARPGPRCASSSWWTSW
jgi:2-polyprenyl-6-methoxyphenol hydroxylase-like FAD-dependent oxidoreductase